VAVCTFTMLSCGLLGFMDDYKKVTEKKSDGVSARTKLFWQLVIALVAASFFYFKKEISGFGASVDELKSGLAGFRLGDHSIGIGAICFPLKKKEIIDLGWLIIPFFATVIIGCSNAVNLTDGLDGLASGCTITVALAYAALAYVAGHYFMAVDYLVIPHNRYVGELAVFLMAMAGACFGFLWFNCNPAVVFMGDTGSLAIGGAIGAAAIAVKQELMLVIIGGVFVMEALSVMIQVTNFKIRKRLKLPDKRIFLMTPIHHHFEMAMMGLSRTGPAQDVTREQKRAAHNKIAIRFWILSIMLALFGLALLKVA
jgi:phospho-N-acetylmuramoyl-pentapeptide-transferase